MGSKELPSSFRPHELSVDIASQADEALSTFSGLIEQEPIAEELFPDLTEQEPVTIDKLKVVAQPEVKTFRRTRNGRVMESREWRCRVQYQLQAGINTQQQYNLLILHATNQYEEIKKLRVQEADVLRVSGRLSANPTPLGNGSDLLVHHLYVTEIEVTKKALKPKRKKQAALPTLF